MNVTHILEEQRIIDPCFPALDPGEGAPGARSSNEIVSPGVLYVHAFSIEHEAASRYREFATLMADYGNDAAAGLFHRLAEFAAEHVFHLAKKIVGIEIPITDPSHDAWLESGAPVPEARAFIFRTMTPRMALEIALRAEQRAKAFFEHMRGESLNARVRKLSAEFALLEQSHIEWVSDTLLRLSRPLRPYEELFGDPTIEQQM